MVTMEISPVGRRSVWCATLGLIALALVSALALSGCSSTTAVVISKNTARAGTWPKPPAGHVFKVGLVSDQGGLADRSFNALANKGLERAEKQLHIKGGVLESHSSADYEPNLGEFAQQKFDLVFAVGFLMADPVQKVAAKAPNTRFGIIDFSYAPHNIPNVRGLVFKEQEAGYLAGALAGMVEQDDKLPRLNSAKVVSAVGGQQIPPVTHYIAGYRKGVLQYCKDCSVKISYSQDFVDQSKCKEQALNQIAAGSDIVFQVAGGCGLGALDAAREKGVWGIGVDADQSYLGPFILTSAIKRVDVAVYDTIQHALNGTLQTGADGVYGYAQNGVGLGKVSPIAKPYMARLATVEKLVRDGKVSIPDTL